jgi:PKD repeat protein
MKLLVSERLSIRWMRVAPRRPVVLGPVSLSLCCAIAIACPVIGQDEKCEGIWEEWDVTTEAGQATQTSLEVDLASQAYVASIVDDRLAVRIISADRQFDLELKDTGVRQGEPDFAANSLGVTYMVYTQFAEAGGGGREILLADNIGGLFTEPLNVSSNGVDDLSPRIALDSAGAPHVTWVQRIVTISQILYWTPGLAEPMLVGSGDRPLIYVDTQDVVHLVYTRDNDLLHNNNSSLAGVFSDERNVVRTPTVVENSPSFGGDRSGNLYVCYEAEGAVFLVLSRPGESFLPPQQVDVGAVADPELRVRSDGRVAIAYTRGGDLFFTSGQRDMLEGAQRIASTVQEESQPSLDLDLLGNIHLSFLRDGQTFYANNACVPEAQFEVVTRNGEAPLVVKFQDKSDGDVKVWLWDFGDGTKSNVPSPEHTYLDPGVYDVSLTVIGTGGREATVVHEDAVFVLTADNSITIPDHRVLPGQVGVWFPIVANHDMPLQGFQVLGEYDPDFLTYTGYSLEFSSSKALEPEFLQVNGGFGPFFEVGCIFDFALPFDGRELLPSEDKRIINLIFDVPSGAPQGETTEIHVGNNPDISRVTNIFTVGGFSVFPKLRGSVIEVVPIRFPLPRLFIRGDVDSNRVVDITDAITLLNFQFLGGTPPRCIDSGDILDQGSLTITSAITLLNFLFLGGAPPSVPFPSLGLDPTPDELADC